MWRRIDDYLRLLCAVAWMTTSNLALAAEYRGEVTFGGLPVPSHTPSSHARYTTRATENYLQSFVDREYSR